MIACTFDGQKLQDRLASSVTLEGEQAEAGSEALLTLWEHVFLHAKFKAPMRFVITLDKKNIKNSSVWIFDSVVDWFIKQIQVSDYDLNVASLILQDHNYHMKWKFSFSLFSVCFKGINQNMQIS